MACPHCAIGGLEFPNQMRGAAAGVESVAGLEQLLDRIRESALLEGQPIIDLARARFLVHLVMRSWAAEDASQETDSGHACPSTGSDEGRRSSRNSEDRADGRLRVVRAEPTRPDLPEMHDLGRLVANLTPRQFEVLSLVAKGLTNREIGQVLSISPNTAKAHVAAILNELELTNRTEAAVALSEFEGQRNIRVA